MPDRIIRDELLTSERYWSVGIEAQRLYIHLLLNADSMGRFSGKSYTIRSACYPGQAVDPKLVEKLLSDLQDADLIRIYTVGDERFLFVPRYRQRLRVKNSHYPEPPNTINDLPKEMSDTCQTPVRHMSAKGRKEGRKEVIPRPKTVDAALELRREVWNAYSMSYQDRYGVEPCDNAEARSAIKRFTQKIPASDCVPVASFYVLHNNAFYVSKGHDPKLLAADAAKLRTEWATDKQITQSEAHQADRRQGTRGVFTQLIRENANG